MLIPFDRFGRFGIEQRVQDRMVRVDQKQPVGLHSGYGTQILLGSFILLIQQRLWTVLRCALKSWTL